MVGDVPGYRSTKDLLDAASQIVPAGMKTCPLRPLEIVGTDLALPAPWDAWNASISLQTIPAGEVVYEEEEAVETVGVFDFGHDLFELEVGDRGAVVKASPMFLFVDSSGTPLTGEPRVLGAGEVVLDPASGRPQPRYGGLWRVVKAMLPAAAGAFHGDVHTAARDAAMRANGDPLDYEGRVALDRTCFEDAAANDFPDGCAWLDSQARAGVAARRRAPRRHRDHADRPDRPLRQATRAGEPVRRGAAHGDGGGRRRLRDRRRRAACRGRRCAARRPCPR